MKRLMVIAILAVGLSYAYTKIQPGGVENVASVAKTPAPSNFRCDGRTLCNQMTSCAEATYFIKHCPNTKMDGDRDGVPCEDQWCGH